MIPIRDEIRSHQTPYVNYTLLAINVLVFGYMSFLSRSGYTHFVDEYALIPLRVVRGLGVDNYLDLVTSLFLHGNLLHLAGNMLYLWIFGDNVEEAMGHSNYILFYLLGGLLASMAHILANPFSNVPTVGASGAIAAVLGAYWVLYPHSRVYTLIPLGFIVRLAVLPAVFVLGLWFVFELVQGFLSLGGPMDVGGVAFWAHIGGFVVGALVARLFAEPPRQYGGPSY